MTFIKKHFPEFHTHMDAFQSAELQAARPPVYDPCDHYDHHYSACQQLQIDHEHNIVFFFSCSRIDFISSLLFLRLLWINKVKLSSHRCGTCMHRFPSPSHPPKTQTLLGDE